MRKEKSEQLKVELKNLSAESEKIENQMENLKNESESEKRNAAFVEVDIRGKNLGKKWVTVYVQ